MIFGGDLVGLFDDLLLLRLNDFEMSCFTSRIASFNHSFVNDVPSEMWIHSINQSVDQSINNETGQCLYHSDKSNRSRQSIAQSINQWLNQLING